MLEQRRSITILRFALGIVFLWFGVLKLFNASPALHIIEKALPPFLGESQIFFLLLSLLEILIGASYLINKFVKISAVIMILHLMVATFSVLFTQGFDPRFPVLSLAGEFVMKNVVLIASGLVLITQKEKEKEKETE